MTDDEALKLKPGDPLVGVVSGRLVVLETVGDATARGWVRVRRLGKTKLGYRFPPILRTADHLRRLPKPDAPAFHVAADWLAERGEDRAAEMLRRAFPLNGEG